MTHGFENHTPYAVSIDLYAEADSTDQLSYDIFAQPSVVNSKRAVVRIQPRGPAGQNFIGYLDRRQAIFFRNWLTAWIEKGAPEVEDDHSEG